MPTNAKPHSLAAIIPMLQENQKIKSEEKDSPEFINILNVIMNSIVKEYLVKEVVYVRINNWFDHKWLNYSGNAVVPFDFGGLKCFPHNEALQSVWRDKISIPPFNPNRVISSKFFIIQETGNLKIFKKIHKHRHSNDNIHNRIENYTSDGLVIWFSSNSELLQKGCLMAYRVQDEQVYTWYATLENRDGWKITKTKGIPTNELKKYLE